MCSKLRSGSDHCVTVAGTASRSEGLRYAVGMVRLSWWPEKKKKKKKEEFGSGLWKRKKNRAAGVKRKRKDEGVYIEFEVLDEEVRLHQDPC